MKSPKTNIGAIACILGGLAALVSAFEDGFDIEKFIGGLTAMGMAYGFYKARDVDRTDAEAGATDAAEKRIEKAEAKQAEAATKKPTRTGFRK
ncbi:hypothetical protein [Cerasicoccus arenae]|uniref:Uncharacterized protein n=1 Tax=Cerasicoccus arenae TaxID=424488 RepID=A0A8J3GEB5_9BACT|nr:hypothetical protein [Cerasicoccus arenae]MBK1858241.1 hypothetical protein [Cerasicoccus arenae]GHC02108.1 hypothetical protein GCM10007047_18280 [Cerasicoccus arenae]